MIESLPMISNRRISICHFHNSRSRFLGDSGNSPPHLLSFILAQISLLFLLGYSQLKHFDRSLYLLPMSR